MKWTAIALMFLSLTGIASAHRLDEYLQATLISVEKDHVDVSMRLIPGIAVSSSVIASIDANGDGVLSPQERWDYAQRVLSELVMSIDGKKLDPKLKSADFPQIQEMQDGLGEIHIEYTAELPAGGPNRKLILENNNQRQRAVYLVNTLVPSDPGISIAAQKRNQVQSTYELDYTQASGPAASFPASWWTPSLFQLGMRHIAEGTDHLLFLLVLLLPAPLLVAGFRWGGTTGVRTSLLRILRIVTAFTLGHSITLALAAFGVVHLPSRPIEVLIAVSILLSAVHALRPIFPGREAGIAAFFGLIHGLAFASTLGELGLGRWERLAGILAFNLGIETMQMAVVALTLPSLILMSRTRAYSWLRVCGALFAGVASLGWIVERVLGAQSSVDVVVNELAHHSLWIAGGLFLLSLVCWAFENTGHALSKTHFQEGAAEPQISPLRYASVEMTKGRAVPPSSIDSRC
jgi:HupE / UreJ protein